MASDPLDQEDTDRFTFLADLPDEALAHIRQRASSVPNPVLKARYYDYLIEKEKGGRNRYHDALEAIASYIEISGSVSGENIREVWPAIDALDRAARLSTQFNRKVEDVVSSLVALVGRYCKAGSGGGGSDLPIGRWTVELIRILLFVREHKNGVSSVSDAVLHSIEQIADDMASEHHAERSYDFERVFLQLAARCAKLRSHGEREIDLLVRHAMSSEDEAEERAAEEDHSYGNLVGTMFCEDALAQYARLLSDPSLPPHHRLEIEKRQA